MIVALTSKKVSALITYNIIELYFCFNAPKTLTNLIALVDPIDYDADFELCYDCILSKFSSRTQVEFFWTYWSYCNRNFQMDEINLLNKLLALFSCIIAKLSESDLDSMDNWLCELDSNFQKEVDIQSTIEYFIEKLTLRNASHLNPHVRALAARGTGLASLVSLENSISYSYILVKVNFRSYLIKETFGLLIFLN